MVKGKAWAHNLRSLRSRPWIFWLADPMRIIGGRCMGSLILLSGATTIWASVVAFHLPLSNSGRVVRGPDFGAETARARCIVSVRPVDPLSRRCGPVLLSSTTSQDEADDPFFDRELEREELLEYLGSKPDGVLIVLGPRNSGKTRLLKEVLLGWLANEPVKSVLGAAVKNLTESLATSLAMLKVTAKFPLVNVEVDASRPVKPVAAGQNQAAIKSVLEVYKSAIKAARGKGPRECPAIWIDEVNRLMEWRWEDPAEVQEVQALLDFFVVVTKQEGRAHVILSTSEYAFFSWLTKDLRFAFATTEVVGDFPKEAAREFAQSLLTRCRLARGQAAVDITETEWAIMYDVCGGSALHLRRAVTKWARATNREEGDVRSIKTLEKALEPIWLRRYGELEEAIEVNPAFAFAASRLCHAPYGILHRRKLDTALRKKGLASVEPADGLGASRFKGASVQDLVKQNLLDVRPPSKWASDVPPEAFPEECNEVVTAYSAVGMYCLKKLGKKGLLPEVSRRLKK